MEQSTTVSKPRWLEATCLAIGIAASLLALVCGYLGHGYAAGVLSGLGFVGLALRMHASSQWQPFAFTFWVLASVSCALTWPEMFGKWAGYPAGDFIPLLIQVIMFGMGTTLSIGDFTRVLWMPKSIFVGMVLQFTVMPFGGWFFANAFGFPPEIAAGVILIGACPGGVASNVITYLARGDVPLSVTMTACSTLMAPLMTPMMMSLLAGSQVDVSFVKMMMSILNLTISPIVLGLVVSYLLQWLKCRGPWLDRFLSALSMIAICVVVAIIVAQSREDILTVGPMVALAAILHNGVGYGLGYYGARLCRLEETACRTIAIEVGMQNGGLASSLAINVLKSPPAALAGAIFGAWMSVSGSVLASWWRLHPPQAVSETAEK